MKWEPSTVELLEPEIPRIWKSDTKVQTVEICQ